MTGVQTCALPIYSNLGRPRIELGTLWSEGRDLTNCANHARPENAYVSIKLAKMQKFFRMFILLSLVTGNMATVPGSPAMQPQPQPSPTQPMNQFVVHVPSQVQLAQPVAPPQGGPITGHPAPASQFVYVSGGPQHASQVATVPVSSSPFQQQPQFTGMLSSQYLLFFS